MPTVIRIFEELDKTKAVQWTGYHLGMIGMYLLVWIGLGLIFVRAYKSELGLTFRFAGFDRERCESLGIKSGRRVVIGLAFANGLVALSGALVTQEQGFADVGMGTGLVVITLASLLIGEQVVERGVERVFKRGILNPVTMVLSPIVGTFLYYMLIGVLLRLSSTNRLPLINLQPTDLKLVTALAVVAVMWFLPGLKEPIPREENV